MPPYLGESAQTAESFYSSLDFSWVTDPSDLERYWVMFNHIDR